MARERSSGAGASVIGMLIFGFLFFVSMILAIVFYTQLTDARDRQTKAAADLDKVARAADLANQQVAGMLNDPARRTVVAQMLEHVGQYKILITGSDQDPLDSISKQIDDLQLGGKSLVETVKQLQGQAGSDQQLIAGLQSQLAERDAQIVSLQKANTEEAQRHTESVAALQSQLDQLTGQSDQHQQFLVAMRSDLGDQIGATQKKYDDDVAERDARIAALEKENKELRDKLASSAGPSLNPNPEREPDGKIVSLISENNQVAINLGYDKKIAAGITFEVFDPVTGVQADDTGKVRGKATIEVVNVSQDSSIARVVQVARGQTVGEGDLIANVVYDPYRTYKFYVFGEFDIDRRGEATVADLRRVEGMITRWGAALAKDLSYDTDFLVLGQEPELPEALSPDEIDPIVIKQKEEQMKTYQRYQELWGQAMKLGIPILNQNRFLSLVGYYRR